MAYRYGVLLHGNPAQLCKYDDGDSPKGGLLLQGDFMTVFTSRRRAQRAIDRSRAYRENKGWSLDIGDYRIIRLSAVDE